MVILQETTVKFNNNLYVSHTGGRLSSESGLALVDEFMDAFHFTEHSKDFVSFKEDLRYWQHDNHKILKQLLFQFMAGYKSDISANILQHDPVLQTLSTDGVWASQPSICRFFDRFTEQTIEDLQILNQILIDQAPLIRNDTNMIIDLDSTHSDTFGSQKQTDYNAHYRTNGYHPLVAFDGLTGDFLKAKLRYNLSTTMIIICGMRKKLIIILFHIKPALGLYLVDYVFVQLEKLESYSFTILLLLPVSRKNHTKESF